MEAARRRCTTGRIALRRCPPPGTGDRELGNVCAAVGMQGRPAELIVLKAVRIIPHSRLRGMAQSGSAPALGAGSRGFKSLCPDQCGVSPGHYLEMRP